MPPPTTVTTAGYWGSTYWSKGYWGADYWKQRIPVPVPPSAPSAGLSSGWGGKTMMLEDLCAAYRGHPEYEEDLLKQLCKKVTITTAKTKRAFIEPDPLSRPRKADPQKAREADVRRLNKRVRELEKELEDAKAANPWELFDEVEVELAHLRALAARLTALASDYAFGIAALEAERARLAAQPTPVAASPFPGVGLFANALPEPTTEERIAQAMADLFPPDTTPAPPPAKDKSSALWYAVAAAAAALGTYYLVPDDSPVLKTIGYTTAAGLTAGAVKELLA
jgi:hypothetical protein